MSTQSLQISYQMCLKLHDFVTDFLFYFWDRTPRHPFDLYYIVPMDVFW